MKTLDLEILINSLKGNDSAFRVVTRLLPAGGASDKVFPPTYANDRRRQTKYAVETRKIEGQEVPAVLLDSVQSQANRHEALLQDAIDDNLVDFPVPEVDFGGALPDVTRITALEAPHRIADAIFRDSLLDGLPFRESSVGLRYEMSTPRNARALLEICPTALLFGVWNSTGSTRGSKSRFQRAIVSEIVGMGASLGVKTSSRIDPLAIAASVPIYCAEDGSWTSVEADAKTDKKGKPQPYKSQTSGKGKASAVNHSNVTPQIDDEAGGVSIDYATQTTVLSLAALRKLRFPADDGTRSNDADNSARGLLAALGLLAITLGRFEGCDLRSRCLLVRSGGEPLVLELIRHDGTIDQFAMPSPEAAIQLFNEAKEAMDAFGFKLMERSQLKLAPLPKLIDLVTKSRQKQAVADEDVDD